MNYELAKELKDAGLIFEEPQTRENTYSYLDSKGYPCGPLGKDAFYIPTLPELIEACGDDFDSLHNTGGDWWAWSDSEYGEAAGVNKSGPTPEEAVAHLWLALNKNGTD